MAADTLVSRLLKMFPLIRWILTNLAQILMVASIFSSMATYYAISNTSTPAEPHTTQILILVVINIILLLALAVFISNKITALWLARKRGSVGSRLQTRIVIMFSLVSIIPTSIVAVFSIFYSIFVIQGWFSERVGVALEESVKVAEGYVDEHRQRIIGDGLTFANYLNSQYSRFSADPKSFARDVTRQAHVLALNEAMVFRKNDIATFGGNKVMAKTRRSYALENQISYLRDERPDLFEKADDGDVVTYFPARGEGESSDRILSLLKLYRYEDAYLLVGRFVDSKVLSHMATSKGAAYEYSLIKTRLTAQQVQFGMVFVIVAILLLLASLWIGISFASQVVEPISALITATESVKAGNLSARVPDGPQDDEIGTLGRAFNRMTGQLEKHNADMLEVNRLIDARRRLTEDVLAGVSAGVIALNSKHEVTIFNRFVPLLLAIDAGRVKGASIAGVFPEVLELLEKASNSADRKVQQEISIVRNGQKLALLVRIVREEFSDEIEGYIVTFDDITELQSAQRSAAWADVARRIAHEIKNPLTPIHLASERLRKKFGRNLPEDEAEIFNRYLDTIVRHVANIGSIVEEFSSFARMPSPKIEPTNLVPLVLEAITSQELVYPNVVFTLRTRRNIENKYVPVMVSGDAGQISQVLTNVLKNSAEAIVETNMETPTIDVYLKLGEDVRVEVVDNGIGFPKALINRITEPYVTTKETGTGLGLAIVKKVMVDHEGALQIFNQEDELGKVTGARVVLRFPNVA